MEITRNRFFITKPMTLITYLGKALVQLSVGV